jgi:hypothetical protein
MTPAAFKRTIRDLQVWCSSCMVAFADSEPIGVLIGAKRPSVTLVHRIAVHPDHLRQGHGRHLLTSLGSKLSILGPPRIVAEVPETLAPARELFRAAGFVEEEHLTDYVWQPERVAATDAPAMSEPQTAAVEGLVIPVTVDDLAANGLLGEEYPTTCWERSVETLNARKNEVSGLAVASEERIEAYILYVRDSDVLSLRTLVDDGGARLKRLLSHVGAAGTTALRLPKVHSKEIPEGLLGTLNFRPAGSYFLFATTARPA